MSPLRWLAIVTLALLAGCRAQLPAASPAITLATTTSTRDSGLLDVLLPAFRRETGIEVNAVAVGSGQAIELGRRGDADVLLTHDPAAEDRFMDDGLGGQRQRVMHNDFVLVGPEDDPAKVAGLPSVVEAFLRIAQLQTPFASRADESGTHSKERDIWRRAAHEPAGDWYIRAGAGMAEALRVASEKRAYALTDRATFLTLRRGLDLTLLVEGDLLLWNPYSAIVVRLTRHPEAARRFAEFLLSPRAQAEIGRFGVSEFGVPLFFPDAGAGDSTGKD